MSDESCEPGAERDVQLGTEIDAPRQARRWIRSTLSPCPDAVADAELIASELVTNAVRAGSASIRLSLTAVEGGIEIGVTDDAPGTPQPRQARVADTSGRGLAIVAATSREWGVRAVPAGKVTWAVLDVED